MNHLSMFKLGLACLAISVMACGGGDTDPDTGPDGPPVGEEAGPGDEGGSPEASVEPKGDATVDDTGTGDAGSDAARCLTACAADDCGEVPTGCGGFLSCGQCMGGLVCGQNDPNKCGAPPPVACTPLTAAQACPNKCGAVSDGCSGVIICAGDNGGVECTAGQTCTNSACKDSGATCTPATCATKNHVCGQDGDGCGGILDCGACGTGKQCKYAAIGNTCEDIPPPACTPDLPAEACMNTCGIVGDGCGGQIDCQMTGFGCPSGQSCGGGGVPGQCGSGTQACTPIAAAEACAGKCGTQSNGCEGTYSCTAANGGQTCDTAAGESCGGGGVANVCGKPPCTPKSSTQACPGSGGNKSCGQQPDGCGGLVDCGGCAQDQQCGLTSASICGTIPSCQPIAAATACAGKCGTVPDGCGGSYNCSGANGGVTCTGNEYCGANNQPNTCGAPPVSCVPKTCAQLGHTCGLASDGCGQVLNCWSGCAANNPSCSGSCGDNSACLSDQTTGAQSCVAGTPTCTGSLCSTVPTTCAANAPTRLTGTVVTPGRLVNGSYINRLPVPNALVYIPADPNVALPSIVQGVTVGNAASCGRCEDEKLVADGQSVLAAAVTDYKGTFTLEGRVPVGTTFKLVVKVGKWRRVVQVPNNVSAACATRALLADYTRLPASSTDGLTGTHLPRIAVSTGSVDEMECVFRNIGVAESEFTLPTASGRVHMYRSNGAQMAGAVCSGTYRNNNGNTVQCTSNSNAGCVTRQSGCSFSNNDSLLYGNQTTINGYDLVVWDCEGGEEQHNDHDAKIETYVNNGGRMFASHFSYSWIEGNGTLDQSADWGVAGTYDEGTGFVSLPTGNTARTGANGVKSLLFRDWLDYQGALSGSTAGALSTPPLATPQFSISEPRDRAGPNVGPSTDEWVYRNARLCSNNANRVCTSNSDCNVCSNNSSRACSQNSDCQSGGSCGFGGSCGNTNNPRVQQLSFNTPYNAGDDAICGRVAYSGFHVTATDNNDSGDFFPGVCSNGVLTAQEKVLVFMLFDLATCVSSGDPPTPPSCTPKTAANVCPGENDACGYVSDGCGGVVNCGGCSAGSYCDGNSCRPQQCTPSTCASLGFTCGEHADGCGGYARNAQGVEGCGVCSGGQICGLNAPGICGGCVQIPKATACPANSCGQVSDGCGGVHDCGTCPSGVCGGDGANRCGPGTCTPIPQATACASKNCGAVSDGCGNTYTCGVCTAPDTCGGGGAPNVCGRPVCTPKTTAEACNGLSCGFVSDGCGGAINCGTCPNGGVCGGDGPNRCGSSCTPTSCEAAGANCGAISDLCGALLNCGNCPSGQTCGAAGPNRCGDGPPCTPRSCDQAGAECGLVGDGCGGVLNCGVCVAPETCGGAGQANQCGTGTGGCNKLTCGGQNVECGQATDGCGGLLDCGSCASGFSCERGRCEFVPIFI